MGIIASIKRFFGGSGKPNIRELIASGAKIIDVRTPGEFAGGHVKGSVNIPLDRLGSKVGKLKKEETIITCCASGMRSGSAKALLRSKGFTNVHNGGSWQRINRYKNEYA